MNGNPLQADLVILASDKNTQFALEGLFNRPQDLGIRPITRTIFVHDRRDPGILKEAHEFMRPYLKNARYSLAVLDREGCGRERLSREEIEIEIEQKMAKNGWQGRCAAIAIDPELEIWVWMPANCVAQVLGWEDFPTLKAWLCGEGLAEWGSQKPNRPKEAMEAALRHKKIPRSSALYKKLAENVPLAACTDPAFCKLKDVLRRWFPQ
ncbi:MAG: methylation-associated defense system protein MAD4 [Thermogutta sp.]